VASNRDIAAAWKYHNATKHSYASVRTNPHFLDWENKPLLFKIYPTLEVMRLPRDAKQSGVTALSAVATTNTKTTEAVPDLESLAFLLHLSAGVTRTKKYPGGETFFRAAACTGALYEIELYLVCGDLPELKAGVYHFGVAEFGLRQLRAGDYRQFLADACRDSNSVAHAPLTIVCTGTYWRNAWKYQARTYRHFGWDNGTLLSNLLAVATALGLPAKVIAGFLDAEVNRLLDVDTKREVAFSLVTVGHSSSPPPTSSSPIKPLDLPLVPLSKTEVDYPAMREMHAASCLSSTEDLESWSKKKKSKTKSRERKAKRTTLSIPAEEELPKDTIEQVILRRGSTRKFSPAPITLSQLSTLLDRATRGIPSDFLEPPGTQLNDLYLIVNAVEGLASGSYFYRRDTRDLELLRLGNFRKLAGHIALEQELPADASVAVFFLADLNKILERFGNRGYRAAQLEAGILGGKLYLAAYAQRLGASGLTFYDDDVVRFFSPHAEGKSAIFLVALGKSAAAPPALVTLPH
jgi:SagB-type dehydrogenase family enzyme